MFAQVQDGAIIRTGFSVQRMFPNVSFSGMPNSEFLTENNIQDVVEAERKDRLYYYVTQGDVVLVDGVPTQQYTNTAMAIEDVDAVDSDGNPIYVQEYDASANGGEGAMVDTSVQMINRGLKYTFKNRIKSQANSALANTDWMVIRKAERSVEIPAATVTYRAAVITEYDRLKVAITGAADVDALAVVMDAQNWPEEAI
tara:strand:+ start:34 stop:630 length:597 start_codon:yes stop_codon:yes gene_type:complete